MVLKLILFFCCHFAVGKYHFNLYNMYQISLSDNAFLACQFLLSTRHGKENVVSTNQKVKFPLFGFNKAKVVETSERSIRL